MSNWIMVLLMIVLLVGSIIYREISNERNFRKAHNKNKKKKFHI